MKYLFSLLLAIPFYTAYLQAQPGTLDKTFGDAGKVIDKDSLHNEETPIAVQKDGRILVGGSGYYQGFKTFALHAYKPDGSPDSSFGNAGIVYTLFESMQDPETDMANIVALAIQPDNKIIALGSSSGYDPAFNYGIVRYNRDGTPDSSFGVNGVITANVVDIVKCMTLQSDGKIVIAGSDVTTVGESTFYKFITARYLPDGQLDGSFGENGKVAGKGLTVRSIAVQEDGKIIAAGYNGLLLNYQTNFYLERYLSDGSPDKSFGIDGSVETAFNVSRNLIRSIVLQPDKKIIAVGETNASGWHTDITMVRYNIDGSLDESFGERGKVITFLPGLASAGSKVLLLNNHIIVAGISYNLKTSNGNFLIASYTPDGTLDSSFADNGVQITDMGGYNDNLNDAALQPNGKIVVAGYIDGLQQYVSLRGLTRYNGYDTDKQPLIVRIKRWLQHRGISWQTIQNGNNIRYYAVQSSSDGVTYKEVAKLSSKMNSYEDNVARIGDSYYRIAAIGWDGSRTYSNTVLMGDAQGARIFPNPARTNLQVQGLPSIGKTNLSIIDINGNVRSTANATGTNYTVNTANLNSGNYLLKIQHGSTVITQPFVKE